MNQIKSNFINSIVLSFRDILSIQKHRRGWAIRLVSYVLGVLADFDRTFEKVTRKPFKRWALLIFFYKTL